MQIRDNETRQALKAAVDKAVRKRNHRQAAIDRSRNRSPISANENNRKWHHRKMYRQWLNEGLTLLNDKELQCLVCGKVSYKSSPKKWRHNDGCKYSHSQPPGAGVGGVSGNGGSRGPDRNGDGKVDGNSENRDGPQGVCFGSWQLSPLPVEGGNHLRHGADPEELGYV